MKNQSMNSTNLMNLELDVTTGHKRSPEYVRYSGRGKRLFKKLA